MSANWFVVRKSRKDGDVT